MTTATPAPTSLRTGSLSRRVIVAVLVLLAIMLGVLAVTTNAVLSARLLGDLEQRLTDRARTAIVLADQVTPQQLVDRLEGDGVSVYLVTDDGTVYQRGDLRPSGTTSPTPEAGPKGGPVPGPVAGPATDPAPVSRTGDVLEVSQDLSTGDRVTVIADASEVRRTLTQVRLAFGVGALAVFVIAVVTIVPIVRRVLRPVGVMTGTALDIAAGDRGRRLNPDRPGTELGQAASAFDAMLDAVEGAERQAKNAEAVLRRFVSDAAHELRTPLAGVIAAAERGLRGTPDRVAREQLDVTVIREARRASRLVESLLDLARIDQGLSLDRRAVDVAVLAEEVAATRRLTSPQVVITVRGTAPMIMADADRLTQILANLVSNSVQAAGPTATVAIELSAPGPDAVTVDVTDDGPGVPEADRDRVFERLVRLDEARSRTDGGAGLGLSIARGLAQAHGGTLVNLPAATGAHFRLTVPTR